ncbi:hypothetical protein L9F63_021707 [Diploptera punctata]|uniref:Uncharacterized protein n=1 Tax=Diploptera punctata TaxID=6984 RepID=A0AAD8EB83_DIPPU|nr:hypothetical protein L9F63_021707 [Diploptera punctata]
MVTGVICQKPREFFQHKWDVLRKLKCDIITKPSTKATSTTAVTTPSSATTKTISTKTISTTAVTTPSSATTKTISTKAISTTAVTTPSSATTKTISTKAISTTAVTTLSSATTKTTSKKAISTTAVTTPSSATTKTTSKKAISTTAVTTPSSATTKTTSKKVISTTAVTTPSLATIRTTSTKQSTLSTTTRSPTSPLNPTTKQTTEVSFSTPKFEVISPEEVTQTEESVLIETTVFSLSDEDYYNSSFPEHLETDARVSSIILYLLITLCVMFCILAGLLAKYVFRSGRNKAPSSNDLSTAEEQTGFSEIHSMKFKAEPTGIENHNFDCSKPATTGPCYPIKFVDISGTEASSSIKMSNLTSLNPHQLEEVAMVHQADDTD